MEHPCPEGPARHLDASRQKLTPHCLAAIFDSQLPSPKLSLKMPLKLPLPHNRGHFFLFQNCPRGEGNCAAIERQKLSRGNFCLAASRCLSGPSGWSLVYAGAPGPVTLHNLRVVHIFFTRCSRQVVPSTFLLNHLWAFLGILGRGEGAPWHSASHRSLHGRHV